MCDSLFSLKRKCIQVYLDNSVKVFERFFFENPIALHVVPNDLVSFLVYLSITTTTKINSFISFMKTYIRNTMHWLKQ